MYSSMEILVLAAKRQVEASTWEEQGRFGDGADGEELAGVRTAAAALQHTDGPDGFCASSVARDLNVRWTFSTKDAANSSDIGREHRDSVSDVVENEAQSTPCFCSGSASTADCVGLSANRVFLRPRSNLVLVGGREGRRIERCGIRRCGRLTAGVLAFLR